MASEVLAPAAQLKTRLAPISFDALDWAAARFYEFIETYRPVYEAAGSPYGHEPEDVLRWLESK